MNNDLEQFSEERLKQLASGKYAGTGLGIQNREVAPLARIALAAKQAKPVEVLQFIINNPEKDGYIEWADCNQDYFNSTSIDHRRVLYTTPQPAHTEQVIKITQVMLDAAVADYCTTGKYTVENIPYELRRQVELEAECTFKAMLVAAPKPESE